MNFDSYITESRTAMEAFPNERIRDRGCFMPNRQLQTPEAGTCIVLRYDRNVADVLTRLLVPLREILPPIVDYDESTFHTTLGVFQKSAPGDFRQNPTTFRVLAEAVEEGVESLRDRPQIDLVKWLYNREALLCGGLPNRSLWELSRRIGAACRARGFPLEMSRMMHITTARFIKDAGPAVFDKFVARVRDAPVPGVTGPRAVDVAGWRCDGVTFELDVFRSLPLPLISA